MYGNRIAGHKRYLCSRKQTVWLFVSKLVDRAVRVNRLSRAVIKLDNRPWLFSILLGEGFYLLLLIFPVFTSQFPDARRDLFVCDSVQLARQLAGIEGLEADNGALRTIDETTLWIEIGLKDYALAFFEVDSYLIAMIFL